MPSTQLVYSKSTAPRVLVVDDDANICSLIARMIAPLGYDVETALDAESALDAMKQNPADVALCDIRMPGRDGVWLIERIQKLYPGTAIVIATGLTQMDPRLTLRPGVLGYLLKPFDAAQAQGAVEKAVAAARSLPQRPHLRLVPPRQLSLGS